MKTEPAFRHHGRERTEKAMREYYNVFLKTEDASEALEHLVILALTAGVIVIAFSIRSAVSRQASKASARIGKIAE